MFTTANFKSQFSLHDFFQTRSLILCRQIKLQTAFKENFSQNSTKTNRSFALDFYEVLV